MRRSSPALQAEMASFDDLEYCKTDLIAAKGIVFCKYSKTSSALKALESVQQTGMVSQQLHQDQQSRQIGCKPLFDKVSRCIF